MMIRITPTTNPPGQLAHAELFFGPGPLEGLRLIGFAIWERPRATGRNVTFPARQYSINGERRSFALVRPVNDTKVGGYKPADALRDIILAAYAAFETTWGTDRPWTGDPFDYAVPATSNDYDNAIQHDHTPALDAFDATHPPKGVTNG